MSIPVLAIVKNGKIEPVDPIDLPEGTRLLLLPNPSTEALQWSGLSLLPDDEADFWMQASQRSLDTVWDNIEDDVYAQLL